MSLYVKNQENKNIYEVELKESYEEGNLVNNVYYLNLIAGIDYINENEDIQDYVKADRFVEDAQLEFLTVRPWDETIKERLEEEGYTRIKELPKIY